MQARSWDMSMIFNLVVKKPEKGRPMRTAFFIVFFYRKYLKFDLYNQNDV
jgi:hypothetical protein